VRKDGGRREGKGPTSKARGRGRRKQEDRKERGGEG